MWERSQVIFRCVLVYIQAVPEHANIEGWQLKSCTMTIYITV